MKKVIVLAGICAAAFGAWKFFSGGDEPAIDTYAAPEFTEPTVTPEPQQPAQDTPW